LRRPSPHQFRDLRAREIQSQHLPVEDRIHAEAGSGESEMAENALRVVPDEDVDHARPHLLRRSRADAVERRVLGDAAGLGALDQMRSTACAVAMEPRRDRPVRAASSSISMISASRVLILPP